ncbi:D-cysteine desulfhydrase family protein [Gemmatimonadota bacterium]
MISPQELHEKLARIPRVTLAHLPTPLERMDALSRELAPISLHIKRDDQTGLAFGGNKARKLEFIMADVVGGGADSIVTWAGVQSNWCRQVAASAARLGIRAVLVLLKKPGTPVEDDGNLLLDRVLGAEVLMVEATGEKSFLELENVWEHLAPVVAAETEAGRNPYLAPVGGSLLEGDMTRPLGAMGYVAAFAELLEQCREQGFTPGTVLLATGSAGTQAGLLVGAKLLSPQTRIVGISVAGSAADVSRYVKDISEAALEELGKEPAVGDEEVVVLDDYLGEGYGALNPEIVQAVKLVASREGVLLDPVYTGKAMAALLDLAGMGFFPEGEKVVFLHTGGTPALFPYREGLVDPKAGSAPGP